MRVTNVWRDNAGNVLSIENYSDATHGRLLLATQARIEVMKQLDQGTVQVTVPTAKPQPEAH